MIKLFPRWFSRAYRATLRNPVADWLRDALGTNATSSGETVTVDTALHVGAVYACVHVIAETVGTLPFNVYRRISGDRREKDRAYGHPVYRLLHDAPNPEMTSAIFEEVLMAHVLTWGNGYARIERSGGGVPVALWPLRPDRIKPERLGPDRTLIYRRTDESGRDIEHIAAGDVIHVPAMGFDGIVGFSPISMAREAIGLAIASQTAAGSLFGNGSVPGGVLEAPQAMDTPAQERLRSSWEALHRGAGNRARVAILEQGMTYKPISFTPEDAQFLESRQFSVVDICRWFRMPPHKVQHLLNATFSNIEHRSIEFTQDTIRPWLVKIEQESNRKLFAPSGEYFAEHSIDALLRGDSDTRHRVYTMGRQWGYYSANDIRAFENLNPIPGGDVYLSPMNMVPSDQIGADAASPEPRALPAPNYHAMALPVIRDAFDRIARVEVDKLRRAWRRETEFGAWRSKFYQGHERHVAAMLEPPIRMAAAITELHGDGPDAGGDHVAAEIAAAYCERSRAEIDAAFAGGGDPAIAFGQCLDRWAAERSADEAAAVLAAMGVPNA